MSQAILNLALKALNRIDDKTEYWHLMSKDVTAADYRKVITDSLDEFTKGCEALQNESKSKVSISCAGSDAGNSGCN